MSKTMYMSVALLLSLSTHALCALTLPPVLAYEVILTYEKMEKENKLSELSAAFKEFYEKIRAGEDTFSQEELMSIQVEANRVGGFNQIANGTNRLKTR